MLVPQALLLALAVTPPLDVVARTPPASATPAAQVVMLSGSATARAAAGKLIPLAPGVLVDRSEAVNVARDAWVVLALLGNGHLVRLDEEMTLDVAQIALIDAPMTKDTASAQLDRLLSGTEKAAVPQRLVGWHASLSAANTKTVQASPRDEDGAGAPEEEKKEPERKKAKAHLAGRQQAEQKRSDTDDLAKMDEVSAPPKEAPTPPKDPPGTRPRSATGEPAAAVPQGSVVPAPLVVDDQLRACVQREYTKLDAATQRALGGALNLNLRLSTTGEVRVIVGGALPAPVCALEWATSHKAQITRAGTRLAVPVK